jgi:integrase/recombinase XerD
MTPLRQAFTRELVIRGTSPRTQECYLSAVTRLACHYRRSPADLSDEQLKDYLYYLADPCGLSASTVNQAVCAFRAFYRWVMNREPEVLWKTLPRMKRSIHRPQVYGVEEIERLLTLGCPHLRDQTFLMTVYGGGLRLREACRLQVEDIHGDRHQIRVRLGKGKKDRYTLLSPRLLEQLRLYYRTFRPAKPWLFFAPQQSDQPLPERTAQRLFERARQRAGLPRRGGLHSLRHSFATHLLESGVELQVIQRLLGHCSISTTTVYLHVRAERVAAVQSPLHLLDLGALRSGR